MRSIKSLDYLALPEPRPEKRINVNLVVTISGALIDEFNAELQRIISQ